ncbi:MAG: diaminopimelate decarboxylase [Actinomycetia bacterium]|nr:diaminopimelate decarboxylase [Actinomycetes bacterium]
MTSSAVDPDLLPQSSRIAPDGQFSVAGCTIEDLAEEFGTPLFVYDEAEIRARCREYLDAFGAGSVIYATKAFLCTALARIVDEEGLQLDVATLGEMQVALRAGVPAARLELHGNNKSVEELRLAVERGVGRVVVDSDDELDRLDELVSGTGNAVRVLIRVTPGIDAHTHVYITTGADDSKFGFNVANGDALRAAQRVAATDGLELAGLHCHIGSQIFVLGAYEAAARVVAMLAAEVEAATGIEIAELNIGGGLGIRYESTDDPPEIARYAQDLQEALRKACADAGVKGEARLLVEPGRSIVGPAGLTVYRVGTIKEIEGIRTYVSVDGGMSDNLRVALYGAHYEAFVPTRAAAERDRIVTVVGKHCESGDIVVRDAAVPADLAVGDLLVTPNTGAYGYSMASNYNKVTRPAVVFVADGKARVVVRRESLEDLLRLDEDSEQPRTVGT